jgi:cell division transport system ATP-binding protein
MILFRNVTKQFDESFALEDLTFSIDPGELVMFTGPSGSGKTTLMRLLIREYTPTSGEIIFDGTPLTRISKGQVHHHRRKIGVVFQDYKLLPELNVWENIALALSIVNTKNSEIERRVTDLLDLVSLTDKAFHFPAQLSGGEAQRVSIARALSTAPKIIFADEPTGNLDPGTSRNIVSLLKKINELGTTVMITTHNQDVRDWLGTARHIVLQKGKIVSDSKVKSKVAAKEKESTEDQETQAKSEKETATKEQSKENKKNVKTTKKEDQPAEMGESAKKPQTKSDLDSTHKPTRKKSFWSWLPFFSSKENAESHTKGDSNKTDHQEAQKEISSQTESSKIKKKKNEPEKKEKIEVAIEDL